MSENFKTYFLERKMHVLNAYIRKKIIPESK